MPRCLWSCEILPNKDLTLFKTVDIDPFRLLFVCQLVKRNPDGVKSCPALRGPASRTRLRLHHLPTQLERSKHHLKQFFETRNRKSQTLPVSASMQRTWWRITNCTRPGKTNPLIPANYCVQFKIELDPKRGHEIMKITS